jgi:hypothetical protein
MIERAQLDSTEGACGGSARRLSSSASRLAGSAERGPRVRTYPPRHG